MWSDRPSDSARARVASSWGPDPTRSSSQSSSRSVARARNRVAWSFCGAKRATMRSRGGSPAGSARRLPSTSGIALWMVTNRSGFDTPLSIASWRSDSHTVTIRWARGAMLLSMFHTVRCRRPVGGRSKSQPCAVVIAGMPSRFPAIRPRIPALLECVEMISGRTRRRWPVSSCSARRSFRGRMGRAMCRRVTTSTPRSSSCRARTPPPPARTTMS